MELFCLKAFDDLSTSRGQSGCIQWRDIVEYAVFHELDPEVMRAFVEIVRRADVGFIEYNDREAERKQRDEARRSKRETVSRRRR